MESRQKLEIFSTNFRRVVNIRVMHKETSSSYQVSLGQSQDGLWIAEVTLSPLSVEHFGAIVNAALTYNTANSPALAKCIPSESSPDKLFFIVSEDSNVEPHAIFGQGGSGALSSLKCNALQFQEKKLKREITIITWRDTKWFGSSTISGSISGGQVQLKFF